jgi:hypothetical protein
MGNCIPTTPHARSLARIHAAELTAQYAAQRAASMQRPTQPVAPNLSYDELVVADANRRIRAEEQKEISIAEKKRFEEDVAEKIALAKDPNHVTRAMIEEYSNPEDSYSVNALFKRVRIKNNILSSTSPIVVQLGQLNDPFSPTIHASDDDRQKLNQLEHQYKQDVSGRYELAKSIVYYKHNYLDTYIRTNERIKTIEREVDTIRRRYT